jgi:hypothetical protein
MLTSLVKLVKDINLSVGVREDLTRAHLEMKLNLE